MTVFAREEDQFPEGLQRRPQALPIDPLAGPKVALRGRLVLMDQAFRVIPEGTIYIDQGNIVAVGEPRAPRPPGFEALPVVDVGGTIYPGLIELHNHLAYNALPLWDVPRLYVNRDQWSGIADYRKLISGPMQIVGKSPELVPALIRYVECKSLMGGVTTSQGIQLFSNAGIRRYYRGIVRNVEQTDEPALPNAQTRIDDVDAKDAGRFLERLEKSTCYLLHLSEGTNEAARKHFLALRMAGGEWAITKQLAGIHCVGMTEEDFAIYGNRQGAMIWSPLSNLLLYGKTADIEAAKKAGVRFGIGADWSPSGSKNLFGELKVARFVSQTTGGVFSDRDIFSMATRDAASILQWDAVLGSIEGGKRADLFVLSGKTGDVYENALTAKETSIRLVMINGIPRYGMPGLMKRLGADGEAIRVGGRDRVLFLKQETADEAVSELSLKASADILREAFRRLPELARELEGPRGSPRTALAEVTTGRVPEQQWILALDELEDSGLELRPRLPLPGEGFTGPVRGLEREAVPLSEIIQPIVLDPLTVADDPSFVSRIEAQPNLPSSVTAGLKSLYG
jgi:hypothetical protein